MVTPYGPDQNGLICGYLFSAGGKGKPISIPDALEWTTARRPPNSRTSSAAFKPDGRVRGALDAHPPVVGAEVLEALREGSARRGSEDAQDNLIAVVNDVAFEFSFDPSQIATLWVSVSRRIAVRRPHPPLALDRPAAPVGQRRRPLRLVGRAAEHLRTIRATCWCGSFATPPCRSMRSRTASPCTGGCRFSAGELGNACAACSCACSACWRPSRPRCFRLLRQLAALDRGARLDEMRQSTEEFSLVIRDLAACRNASSCCQEEVGGAGRRADEHDSVTLTMVTVLPLPIIHDRPLRH